MANQILLEVLGCKIGTDRINDFKDKMRSVLIDSGAHIVSEIFYQFEPRGVSGIFILAESHVSIHTWPEESNRASFDIFTCGDLRLCRDIAINLVNLFEPKEYNSVEVSRPGLSVTSIFKSDSILTVPNNIHSSFDI